MTRIALVILASCTGAPTQDSASEQELPTEGAVVATVSADYTVGAVALVSFDDWRVSDDLFPVSPDPAIIVDEGVVIQIDKYGYDLVRLYTPGAWLEPAVEFSVGAGENPQDAEICGGSLYVSLYEDDELAVYDVDGTRTGSVDLSPYADSDGLPEASALVEAGGNLYVAMNELDRSDPWSWSPSGPGVIAEIPCGGTTISRSWEVGPNPSIFAYPELTTRLVVRSGVYYDENLDVVLDGELAVLDTETSVLSTVVTEETLGANITAFAGTPEGAVFLTEDPESTFGVHCLNLDDGQTALLDETQSFLIDVAANSRGEAWVLARPSWVDGAMESGILVLDIGECESLTGEEWIATHLPPYAIGFY